VKDANKVTVSGITLNSANYKLNFVSREISATISPLDISSATVTLGKELTYTGSSQTQSVQSVKVGTLTLDTADYTISGNTGTDIDKYTLTITGTNNCTGSVTTDWFIGPDTSKVDALTKDNVKLTDKKALEDAVAAIEETPDAVQQEYADEKEKCEDLLKEIADAQTELNTLRLDDGTKLEAWIKDSESKADANDLMMREEFEEFESQLDDLKTADPDAHTIIMSTYGDKLKQIETALYTYEIVEGNNAKWYKSSGKTLTFVINGDESYFDYLTIDDKKIAKSNYTVSTDDDTGYTVITLKSSYLEKLTTTNHSIQFFFDDNETEEGKFTVAKASSSPKTGDSIMDTMVLMILSGAAAAVLLFPRKKRR